MRNNIVLVEVDPVRWKTRVRRQGVEPEAAREEAMPYYIGPGRANESFSEEERQAIAKVAQSAGTVLIRQDRLDGVVIYTPIKEDGDSVMSFFKEEASVVHDIVEHFLCLLGGSNIRVYTACNQEEFINQKRSIESKNKLGNAAASGEVDVSTNSANATGKQKKAVIESTMERTDRDFKAAHEWLGRYPWMREKFGPFLEQVEKGTLHGLVTRKFGQIICKEIRDKFQSGINVAAKYQLIKASSKTKLSAELKNMVRLEDTWEYSFELP